jgi:predicted ABC-type ATPase
MIALGMSPFSPETAAIRAGRLMLDEIKYFARRKVDLGFETTLSGRVNINLVRFLKSCGYEIHIFYLWIPSVGIALSRVKARVAGGGHNIPDYIVRRRFDRSIRNFLLIYRTLADSWILFNNSDKSPSIIALMNDSKVRKIDEQLFGKLIGSYGEK